MSKSAHKPWKILDNSGIPTSVRHYPTYPKLTKITGTCHTSVPQRRRLQDTDLVWLCIFFIMSYYIDNSGLEIKAKKCLYEGIIVPTALYGAKAWGMRSAERRNVNVLEIKCLRSLVGVSRMDRVRNEEVRRELE